MRSWPRRRIFLRGKLDDRVGWWRVGMACLWAVLMMLANHGSWRAVAAPNFLIILADDLGFGDVGAYGSKSTLPTPHLDRLASEGMRFTDAHTPSAVCTPTRYGLLTGRYAWRSPLKRGVLNGYSPPLMSPDRLTLARFLKGHGYHTGMIGKWHLGLGFALRPEGHRQPIQGGLDLVQAVRWGPNDFGFDENTILPASLDFPPYVYLQNQRVTSEPFQRQLKQPFPAFLREGPIGADFKMESVLDHLMDQAVGFLENRPSEKAPFFLYVALTSPHKPVLPHSRFRGRTALGPYGDFVVQTDDAVGRLLQALDDQGLSQETVVLFTSDNGSFMRRVTEEDHVEDATIQGYRPEHHQANGPLRGTKADIWEAGHRVPFLMRFPPLIPAGSQCDQTVCLTDVFATFADLMGRSIPEEAAEDSFSMKALLTDPSKMQERPPVIHHSAAGIFAIRQQQWKLILGSGSGGRALPKGKPFEKPYGLFDLGADLSESRNRAEDYPEKVAELQSAFEAIYQAQ